MSTRNIQSRRRNYQAPSKDIVSFAHMRDSGKYPGGCFIIGLVLLQPTLLRNIFPTLQTIPVWIRKQVVVLPPAASATATSNVAAVNSALQAAMKEVDRIYNKLLKEAILRENVFVVKLMVPRRSEVSSR